MLYSVKWLVETSLNHIVNYLLATKLTKLLNSGRVAHVIDVIHGKDGLKGERFRWVKY